MATKDRIYIDKDFLPLADQLVTRRITGSESSQGVFRDTRELVAFAAGLGYRKGRRYKLKEQGREIKLTALHGIDQGGAYLLNAIAVAAKQEVAILSPDRATEKAAVLEDYLNGGLEYISGVCGDETVLDALVDIIKSEHAPQDDVDALLVDLSKRKIS